MQIRKATTDEAAALTTIAHDAKRHWGYPDHWIEHWQNDLTISPEFVAANPVYVAESDGQLLGFYALIVRDDQAELDHLWVAPEHLGAGVGKELFLHAMQDAARRDVTVYVTRSTTEGCEQSLTAQTAAGTRLTE